VDIFYKTIALSSVIFSIFFLVKNYNTYKQHSKITDAIFEYQCSLPDCDAFSSEISYDAKEPYGKTLFRVWDWGCENIVPKEVFEKIRHYIQ